MLNTLVRKPKNHALTSSYCVFFVMVFGFFSVVRNIFFYMSQYLHISLANFHHARLAFIVSLLLGLAGYQLMRPWGCKNVLKGGVVLAVAGLLMVALATHASAFIGGSVFFIGGLAFSLPALVLFTRVAFKKTRTSIALSYGLVILVVACSDGLLAVVNSYYGFKELCCALAVLLISSVLLLRAHSPLNNSVAQ